MLNKNQKIKQTKQIISKNNVSISSQKINAINHQSIINNHLKNYLILIVGALLLYGWTATFGFGFDDSYIIDSLKSIDNNSGNFFTVFTIKYGSSDYRPITILSFWIEKKIFGVFLPGKSHLINTFLFAFLLTRIYKLIVIIKFNLDENKLHLLALFTAIIFLIHPNHVSVVANIKSRDNILSMLFGILAAIQFIKLYDTKKWWRILTSACLLFIAFLSKMDAYVFAILPILVFLFYRDFNIKKIFFFVVFSIIFYFAIINIKDYFFATLVHKEMVVRNTIDNPLVYNNSFVNRISLGAISLLYYLKFLIIPFGYHFYFGFNKIPILPIYHPIILLSFALYISLGIAAVFYFKKNKIYLFSFLFFLLSIAYASNVFIPIAGIIMDRYNFIASLGFCLAIAFLIINWYDKYDYSIFSNKFILLFFLIFITSTIYRTSAWKVELTLYKRDIKYLKNSAHANQIIASVYINDALTSKLDKLTADQNITIGEKYIDNSLSIFNKSSTVWESKGIISLYKGDNIAALQYFKTANKLDTSNLSAINYIGVTYRNLNNFDSASYYYKHVIVRENQFGYSADNLLQLYANYNMSNQMDSLFNVLMQRFPNDIHLNNKFQEFSYRQK